ncbi:putative actin filament network formation [Trypoxylus dichotomus]
MMDLLVQIVTAHHLQLSGHILEALEMAPSTSISDRVLPYKPNTPIGALDTQHIRVVPKHKSIPASKNVSSGHQPFESTFRLKVHLPRNQLYVTRVSQNVYLEDIMNKVCKEKDLDPSKYEFRHPGNLDEVLDPKLTLSDYQITEIYVVSKGTGRLTQAFSTSDIMALRKEEERKQFQAKTGGGVFNLIFKRGKSNQANGSISSDNRSISPTHSDDSRSVTPPGVQPSPIIKEPPSTERPKPPQRKRRPAPKPPQAPTEEVKVEKPASQISNNSQKSDTSTKKAENGLLICHSRNSSDSSGYHEASILSDNCNTSLPRRTGNLTKTSVQYKSTSSLALHGRKKKAAPPPPPTSTPKSETSNAKLNVTSPVVASQPVENLPGTSSLTASHDHTKEFVKRSFKLPLNLKFSSVLPRFTLKPIRSQSEPVPETNKPYVARTSFLSIPSLDSFTNISTFNLIARSKSSLESRDIGDFKESLARKINPIFLTRTPDFSKDNSSTSLKDGVKLTQNYYSDQIFQSTSAIDVDNDGSLSKLLNSKSVHYRTDITETRSVQNSVKKDVSNLRRIKSSDNVCDEDINWSLTFNLVKITYPLGVFVNNTNTTFCMPVSLSLEKDTNTPLPAPRRSKLVRVESKNRSNENEEIEEPTASIQQISKEEIPSDKFDICLSTEPEKTYVVEQISSESTKTLSNDTDVVFLDDVNSSSEERKQVAVNIQPYSNNNNKLVIDKTKDDKSDHHAVTAYDLDLVEANLSLQLDINPYLENTAILAAYNEIQNPVKQIPKSPTSLKDEEYFSSGSHSRRHSRGSASSFISDFSMTSSNSKGSKPEIVGVIPKKKKQSNFDTLSRKRGFHIGSSLINMEAEYESESITSLTSDDKLSDHASLSSKTSDYSTHPNDFEMNDINEEIFTKSVSKKTGKKLIEKHTNELHGMHSLDADYNMSNLGQHPSASSLKSMDSIPGFMGGSNMRKWKNVQDLDDISVVSTSSLHESISTVPTNQTPPDSISSSIIQPSTAASSSTSTRTSLSNVHSSVSEKVLEPVIKETKTPPSSPTRKDSIQEEEIKTPETEMSIILSESKNEADSGICEKEDLELETVWQYQLPSPPKAFRDASPIVPATISQYDTETLPDSVVTNPELFEKLQYVKDIQDAEIESDIPSVISEEEKEICNKLTLEHLEKRKSLVYNRELATSLKFAQDNESSEHKPEKTTKSDLIEELEDNITRNHTTGNYNNKASTLNANITKPSENFKASTLDRNLPNFQISSYDTKKEKINIFEDDTIRSNSNQISAITKTSPPPTPILDKPENRTNSNKTGSSETIAQRKLSSSETIAPRKHSSSESNERHEDEIFKKPQEISAYRLKNSFYEKNKNINANTTNSSSINRSGSFSMNTEIWTPTIPVKRSKSQVALNKYKEDSTGSNTKSESLSRSNSLLDVSSSLQSLEVIKKIQNKLSNSKEELDAETNQEAAANLEQEAVTRPAEQKVTHPPKPTSPPIITMSTWTPPSINLGTWSQRPKTQVMVKEDKDYKFSTKVNTLSTVDVDSKKASALNSTSSFNTYKPNAVSINSTSTNSSNNSQTSNGVSIKVNTNEQISTQAAGNVVIKIGGSDTNKELDSSSSRFINHFTPEGYRKPFGNVNKIDRARPHSIAFDNQFDISRVPVVRSVELKKPFKDLQNNKSITQIYSNSIKINDEEPKSLNYSNSYNYDSDLRTENKQSKTYSSNESINKPVFRNNSFTPIVKGFRTDGNPPVTRKVWSMYGTLPTKPENQNEFNTNRNVPFSQMNLRRTESNKVLALKEFDDVNEKSVVPPPPPQLSKECSFNTQKPVEVGHARAELLNAIRNFGGKTGLRASKG